MENPMQMQEIPSPFRFQQFEIQHNNSSMKVGTDAVLLGAWADVSDASRILDIGSGCGILTLMLAQRICCSADKNLIGVDIDSFSVEEATENAKNSIWKNQIQFQHTSIQQFCGEKNRQAFDLIISNPPFFVNSLKSPVANRNQSRHTDTLSFNDLVNSVLYCLTENGTFALVLPADSCGEMENLCAENGLFCYRKLEIRPKEGKTINRVLLQFKRGWEFLFSQELIIRNADGSYTENYKELTKYFHPQIFMDLCRKNNL